jgi:hypothetical protein
LIISAVLTTCRALSALSPERRSLPMVETAMLPSTAALPPVPMPSQTSAQVLPLPSLK